MGEPLVAAEVVFIGLVGEVLEAVTFDRTRRALGKLSELFPHLATANLRGLDFHYRWQCPGRIGNGAIRHERRSAP